jgi:hypothetical protein
MPTNLNPKNPSKYTPEIIDFLRENFPKNGAKYCQDILGPEYKISCIREYANRNGIKRDRSYEGPNFNIEEFKSPSTPLIAYFLGNIWGDGYIPKDKKGRPTGVKLNVQTKDGEILYKMYQKLGHVTYTYRTNKLGHTQYAMRFSNAELARFLTDMDYQVKSTVSPTKILQLIPKELHKFFWLGFSDADGCICVAERTCQACFAGSYSQDWTDLINFIQSRGCHVVHSQDITATGKRSTLNIQRFGDVIQLYRFLYSTFEQDSIGLPRKYDKFLEAKARFDNRNKDKTRGVKSLANGLFKVNITFEGRIFSSTFLNKDDAILAYDLKSVELRGHHAITNYPLENYMELGVPYVFPIVLPSIPVPLEITPASKNRSLLNKI